MRESGWELHARSGRAVLVRDADQEVDPSRLRLPDSLVEALHEWAHVAEAAHEEDTAAADRELISQRGRQLAMRLAAETGGQVGYLDPLSGRLDRIGRPRPAPPHRFAVPVPAEEPTPWGPGLVVSTIVGAIATVTLVVVTLGLADVSGVLAAVVNLAVAAGFAPSIWLGRNIAVWRWVAYGTAAGIVLAWLVLLLSLLGPTLPHV
ncbi:DUF2537 domain-containing protein [Saccharopolyspora hirsuta]|uniref:DUF2537 domain-containing protein n=1 Tax=Saccharopolyspora hirsuta TaxID=1837 RepID=A0A5M7BB97_SACHI|nr:DUF2537 domain-containing protein [Saccharopolyspora hirsuta]KAA5824651.1 DUF2537 domain-containing protein [Saccharopolyspora hirsuta]